jgi:hypothetical protein
MDRPGVRPLLRDLRSASHEDVQFTRAMTKSVQAELNHLASWLALDAVEPLSY